MSKAVHSAYYRRPLPAYKDKTLLIVGSGLSGHDLAGDLNGYASKVVLAVSNLQTPVDLTGVHFRLCLVSFRSPEARTATFADGTVEEGIEYCILATGNMFDFPFLQPPLMGSKRHRSNPSLETLTTLRMALLRLLSTFGHFKLNIRQSPWFLLDL
jgi:hypothetical protein